MIPSPDRHITGNYGEDQFRMEEEEYQRWEMEEENSWLEDELALERAWSIDA